MLALTAQSAACNLLHGLTERCARWLLLTHDRVGKDSFDLTHDILSTMLGVHRPAVTIAAGTLQKAGLIKYARGRVTIADRERLEQASCDCYRAVEDEFRRLLGGP
jgi:Mn-dependent DtxR family transcriptional regulator